MKERKGMIEYVQEQLGLKADGLIGPLTTGAVNKAASEVAAIDKNWSVERKVIALVQVFAIIKGIEAGSIDGLIGPQTLHAFEELEYLKKHGKRKSAWRKDHLPGEQNNSSRGDFNPNNWPTYSQIQSVFGQPGQDLVTINLPYPMRLSWDTKTVVRRLTCHKKVAKSLKRVLTNILDFYGEDTIEHLGLDLLGGCYNQRKMRGGSKPSTHSWGVAIDLHPLKNQLKWDHRKAVFAQPAYDYAISCFIEEGWVSLGESKDYDWMHFQAVKLG